MAFVKKTWKDRIVQYANRRLLTKSGGEVEQVTVTRDEGTISEAGDQFNASNMNDLEQRVKDGFDGLNASDIKYSGAVTVKDELDDLSDNVNRESYKTLSSSDMTFDSGLSLHQTNQVYRIGRWCILTISVKINRSVSGNCYITNYIPSDYLPYLKYTTAVENGLGDGKVTPIELQTDGKLRIFPTALNTNIYAIGTVIYPLAEQ